MLRKSILLLFLFASIIANSSGRLSYEDFERYNKLGDDIINAAPSDIYSAIDDISSIIVSNDLRIYHYDLINRFRLLYQFACNSRIDKNIPYKVEKYTNDACLAFQDYLCKNIGISYLEVLEDGITFCISDLSRDDGNRLRFERPKGSPYSYMSSGYFSSREHVSLDFTNVDRERSAFRISDLFYCSYGNISDMGNGIFKLTFDKDRVIMGNTPLKIRYKFSVYNNVAIQHTIDKEGLEKVLKATNKKEALRALSKKRFIVLRNYFSGRFSLNDNDEYLYGTDNDIWDQE
ncbi:hypothetical protein LJB91_01915 [Bacteroidales bacterium OttesenSCG-928-L03]|nr:hypothetical protein [Bacteroidales bacterium OttesenSCG-928-L03]